jgi:type II secretory pathway pseudopilin PulG
MAAMKLRKTTRRRAEAGYSLLMAVFMVATIIIFSTAVVPNVLLQGRREREEEAIWRGEQYARAIGLHFRKFGRYPAKLEDLTRQTNGVRFLRQAYPDPMNKGDGSWRLIYVGPNGQLIGSLRRVSLLQSMMATPTLPGATPASALAQPGGFPGAGALGAGALPGTPSNPATTSNPLESQPQALNGAVLGGNIIGVGSKVKRPSLRVYQGGNTYELWEFVWNPMGQIAIPGIQPTGPSGPQQGGAPGVTQEPQSPGIQQNLPQIQMPQLQLPQNPR